MLFKLPTEIHMETGHLCVWHSIYNLSSLSSFFPSAPPLPSPLPPPRLHPSSSPVSPPVSPLLPLHLHLPHPEPCPLPLFLSPSSPSPSLAPPWPASLLSGQCALSGHECCPVLHATWDPQPGLSPSSTPPAPASPVLLPPHSPVSPHVSIPGH